MITKYNLFTVNKWILKTPKSILYQKILDLQGSNSNVVRDTSNQYGDHFCEIVLTSNNEEMGRTRIWDERTDGRTDGQAGDYILPRIFSGSITKRTVSFGYKANMI